MAKQSVYILQVAAFAASLSALAAAPAYAQPRPNPGSVPTPEKKVEVEEKKEKKEKEKVQTGVIANTGTTGVSGAIDVQTSGASPGDEKSAITGSVSSVSRTQCVATVSNASKNSTYAVRFEVLGRNQRGANTFSKSFSATLRPEGSVSKEFRCNPDDNLSVELKSATKRE